MRKQVSEMYNKIGFVYPLFCFIVFFIHACSENVSPNNSFDNLKIEMISPIDSSNNNQTEVHLKWTCEGIDFFDVYLDTIDPPQEMIGNKITVDSLFVKDLKLTTKYFWKVIGYTANGELIESQTSNFTIKNFSNINILIPIISLEVQSRNQYVFPDDSYSYYDTLQIEADCNIIPYVKTYKYQNDSILFSYESYSAKVIGSITLDSTKRTLNLEYNYSYSSSTVNPLDNIYYSTTLNLKFSNLPYVNKSKTIIESKISNASLLEYITMFKYHDQGSNLSPYGSIILTKNGLNILEFTNSNFLLQIVK